MNRRKVVVASGAVAAFGLLIALGGIAAARPGGGDSFSGGGGHSSGGGGGGGGGELVFELIYWSLRLCIYYPQVGLPLIGGILIFVLYSAYKQHQNKDWDSGPPVVLERTTSLDPVRSLDPDFSPVVFEDFAFRLFSTAHRARATADTLATVAPYVGPAARDSLVSRPPVGVAVEQVVVGAMRPYRVDLPSTGAVDAAPQRVRIGIEFEANVATKDHTYYSVESWLFGRDASRTSKPPGATKDFPCPSCGAPWQASATGTQQCASCSQVVDNGRFDWAVEQISLASMDERPPTLTTDVSERGTDLPTYRHRDVDRLWQELTAADPEVTKATLQARLELIYGQLNASWSENDLEPARGLVSDGLFDYLQYWVDAYKRQGLRNQLTGMRITKTDVAKVSRDRWYDAVTIRLWGIGKDFVVKSATGQIMRGSKHYERSYSEYWTLIRSAARKGAPKADKTCGNCGAPMQITMAGACEHCGAHVTAGEFDWVLSKIEQDDTYRG